MPEFTANPGRRAADKPDFIVPDRFRGPPFSGNGGYVAGAAASLLNVRDPVEVTLRSPIPLDEPMQVDRQEGTVAIWQGDTLIAEVRPAELALDIPAPPDWAETRLAQPYSPALMDGINPLIPGGTGFHPVCFCCGADHEQGLKVFAAPVQEGAQVAAIWETRPEWATREGNLPDAFLWTALDCPGQFAFLADGIRTGLLGRITAQVHKDAPAGQAYLVSGWRISIEGKKHFAGTAIHDENGHLVAAAKSVWIGRQDMVVSADNS